MLGPIIEPALPKIQSNSKPLIEIPVPKENIGNNKMINTSTNNAEVLIQDVSLKTNICLIYIMVYINIALLYVGKR